jgi:hypothetical protein
VAEALNAVLRRGPEWHVLGKPVTCSVQQEPWKVERNKQLSKAYNFIIEKLGVDAGTLRREWAAGELWYTAGGQRILDGRWLRKTEKWIWTEAAASCTLRLDLQAATEFMAKSF